MVDANKVKLDADAAIQLLDGMERLYTVKGKRIEQFDLTHSRPGDDLLIGKMLGPTGNLRAPTIRVGRVLVVGFNAEAYHEVLGSGVSG